jgi:hypothetical protein
MSELCAQTINAKNKIMTGVRFMDRDQRSLSLFTAARTCYCSDQKIFTRPDDCAAL